MPPLLINMVCAGGYQFNKFEFRLMRPEIVVVRKINSKTDATFIHYCLYIEKLSQTKSLGVNAGSADVSGGSG